ERRQPRVSGDGRGFQSSRGTVDDGAARDQAVDRAARRIAEVHRGRREAPHQQRSSRATLTTERTGVHMRAVGAVALACGLAGCSARATTPCADLKSLSLGDATITKAQAVPAGPFAIPAADPGARAESITMPAFCRVQGVIAPAKDSHIEFEVWLPASAEGSGAAGSGWNGKYQGVGNGAFAGSIEYVGEGGALASALKAGDAASSTDTGHHAAGFH